MKIISTLLLLSLLASTNDGSCQKKNELAITLQAENITKRSEGINPGAIKNAHPDWSFSFGGVYERMFSNHSSGVIGVKFRKALNDIFIPVPAGANLTDYVHFLVAENFLTVPFLYKYNSNLINISAGTSFDYFLSWKQQERYFYEPLQTYDLFFDRKLSIGLLTSISKKFHVDKNIILEPSIYYNRILSFNRTYYGCSFEIKYKF
jgi:hypothetical protein